MANPPAQQGTLAWARPLTRVAAGALVLLGVVGVVAGLLLPWSRFDPAGAHRPPTGLLLACALLGPGLSGLALALDAAGARLAPVARRVAALGALAVAAFAVLQLVTIRAIQGYGVGGPLAVLGAVALAGGW